MVKKYGTRGKRLDIEDDTSYHNGKRKVPEQSNALPTHVQEQCLVAVKAAINLRFQRCTKEVHEKYKCEGTSKSKTYNDTKLEFSINQFN